MGSNFHLRTLECAPVRPLHGPNLWPPGMRETVLEFVQRDIQERWNQASVHEFHGTYGDYLVKKVSKVFPAFKEDMLG